MARLSDKTKARAMRECDEAFDGQFWVGVHSTGIFCLPSCKARTPLLKNVRFYDTREDALAAGLRPCKRCKSDRYPDVLEDWVRPLVEHLREHVSERFTETDLAVAAGVDISTIRRHFKKHLGITPLAFHRRLRLRHAAELIDSGVNYLSAAYETGYESSSGFREAFEREFGQPPGRYHAAD